MGGKKKLLAIPIDDNDSAASSSESSQQSTPKPKSKRKTTAANSKHPKSRSKNPSKTVLLQDLDARYTQLERLFQRSMHSERPPESLDHQPKVPSPETKKQQDNQAFDVNEKLLEEKIIGILQKHSKPPPPARRRAPRQKSEQPKLMPPKVNQIECPPSQEQVVEQVQVKEAPKPQECQEQVQSQYAMRPQQTQRQVHNEDDRYYQMIFSRY